MVSRVYVEKKPGFDVEAQQLCSELHSILGIDGLAGLRLVNRYDVEGISDELFAQCVPTVFSEPQSDIAATDARCRWSSRLRGRVPSPGSSTSVPIRQTNAFNSSARASVPRCAAPRCTCLQAI